MVGNAGRRASLHTVLLALFCFGCTGSDVQTSSTAGLDDWPIGNPEAVGFDAAALDELVEDIEAGEFPNTHALLIEHDGLLVLERYFSGSDERWGTPLGSRVMSPDSLHDLRSISKSVTSALLGVALADDFDAALSRPVADYLPELGLDASQGRVTLHHVLTMTPGLEWNEMDVPYTDPMNDEIALYEVSDPAMEVMNRELIHEPGSTWYYSGGTTQVLAAIITELTGQTIDDFARDRLFGPLGITEFEWLGPNGWTPDNPAAMSGLRLTARDLAKFGSVYLHGGRRGDRQIVPEAWVTLSSNRHVPEIGDWSFGGVWGYGFQWWVGDLSSGHRVVAGVGNGNQRLFVVPEEQIVVTIFAGEYNVFEGHSNRILDRVLAARR